MARSFDELKAQLSPEDQATASAKAQDMFLTIKLQALRKQRGMTQQQAAELLHVKQAQISKLERNPDMYLSTLAKYIAAFGGQLEITAKFHDETIHLTEFPNQGFLQG